MLQNMLVSFLNKLILVSLFGLPMFLSAQNRPNILVIVADDVGIDALSVYGLGNSVAATPNLDALMAEGITFTNAWSYPTCAPSRAALLTGRYGNKNGVLQSGPNLPNNQETLFEQVSEITNDAYAKALIGKWHLGNAASPNNQGVDYYMGSISCCVPDYLMWERTENGVTNLSTDYVTTHYTDAAIDWVDQQTQPWLLWLAHNAPHSPFHIPPDSLFTHPNTNGNLNKFIAMIESIDYEVGRLYNSLSPAEKDSTLLIFVGDNGTPNNVLQNYPNGHGKNSLYEGGIRVPMFVMGYGVERINETEDALVNFADLFATVTELLGVDLPGGVDNSFSFLPLLSDANAEQREYNYSEQGTMNTQRAIRNQQYKLIQSADGTQEFFDLSDDPQEFDNLLNNNLTTEQMSVLADLKLEADSIFISWSCRDGIQNGNEEGIDCGGTSCVPCLTNNQAITNEKVVTIFPNPVTDFLMVKANEHTIREVQVYDIFGNVVLKPKEINGSFDSIDLSALSSQVYFLVIYLEDGIQVEKIEKR